MLFILIINPLQRILDLPTQHGVLTPLSLVVKLRTSLYADDAVIFVNPSTDQLQSIKQILHAFEDATGLTINFEKNSLHPISYENMDLTDILQLFLGSHMTSSSYRYLGLQLQTRPLKNYFQALWKNWKVTRGPERKPPQPRRVPHVGHHHGALLHADLSSTYHLTRKQIDKVYRSFLWKGMDAANDGHCLLPFFCYLN